MTKTQTLKNGPWGLMKPGDVIIGLNYAVVASVSHTTYYGYPTEAPSHQGKTTLTFEDGSETVRPSWLGDVNFYRQES